MGAACTHVTPSSSRPPRAPALQQEKGRVCLWETLTSAGGFPNYNLDFLTPACGYINPSKRAGIPNSLPKFDLKSWEVLVSNGAVTLICP